MASKLKPMDLNISDVFLVHLVMTSLPKNFDNFVVNYKISPEKWNFEELVSNCVQEEERIKRPMVAPLTLLKITRKRATGHPPQKQNSLSICLSNNSSQLRQDQCLHCKKTGHFKKDCPDFLKMIMAKKGIPFDKDYTKKRKIH
uniref:CCHC-type domain-containing protein n=1 Tax=Oryza meridionalis TaxID=40149 RepID=A0A0E0CCJ9_9ORYZ